MDASRAAATGPSSELISSLQKVISSVLNDDGFTIPTEECKRCLVIAKSREDLFHQTSPSCRSHVKWLADQLNKLINNAKKRGSRVINEGKLWSTYHKLRTSVSFEQTWEKFLDTQVGKGTLVVSAYNRHGF